MENTNGGLAAQQEKVKAPSGSPGEPSFWPEPVDYNDAVQNPQECFSEADLRQGQVGTDMLGLPITYAGNFANVYQLQCPAGKSWAIKCFTRKVPDLQDRYQAISAHLDAQTRAFHVTFDYQPTGIVVRGAHFPLLKMHWVEGFTLNQFLTEHADNTGALQQLARLWVKLANELREARMGHGDLQHGNVLLVQGSKSGALALKLIDYDGMWVPVLADNPPGERGHPNYQHPQRLREGGWSSEIDHFSHLVIYTALRALTVGGRALWDRYDNSENMLFRASDFQALNQSVLIRELWALADPQLRLLLGHLVLATLGPLERVPFLGDLLDKGEVRPLSAEDRDRVRAALAPPSTERRSRLATVNSPPLPLPVPVPELPVSAPETIPDWLSGAPGAVPLGPNTHPRPLSSAEHPQANKRPSSDPALVRTVLDLNTPTSAPVAVLVPEVPVPGTLAVPVLLEAIPVDAPLAKTNPHSKTDSVLDALPVDSSVPLPVFVEPITEDRPRQSGRTKLGERNPRPPVILPLPLPYPSRSTLATSDLVRFSFFALGIFFVLLLLALLVWFIWRNGGAHTGSVGIAPSLLDLPEVTLKAGKPHTIPVQVTRGTYVGDMKLKIEGLPAGMTYKTQAYGTANETALALFASPDLEAYSGRVLVSLWTDQKVSEQPLQIQVIPFRPPEVSPIDPVSLLPGERRGIPVLVKRRGNRDPLAILVEDLPSGVTQERPNRVWVLRPGEPDQEVIEIILEAHPSAPANVKISRWRLLADGVSGPAPLVPVSVEKIKPPVRVSVTAPGEVEVEAGKKRTVRMEFERKDYEGPVRFLTPDLPEGVTSEAEVADTEANSVDLEFQTPRLDEKMTHKIRVLALVDGKQVGETAFDLTILKPQPVVIKPKLVPRPPVPLPVLPKQNGLFQSYDQVNLRGTLYPSSKGKNSPCVLMLPDLENQRNDSNWESLAIKLQEQGYTVFTFDFRGHGASRTLANPQYFYNQRGNLALKAALKRPGGLLPATLERSTFPPHYLPALVQDVVAARSFLDGEHDKGELNTSNLIVIGAGESAAIGALWLSTEMHRYRKDQAKPEGRDIVAAIWIGAHFKSRILPAGAAVWLQDAVKGDHAIPMAFIYGEKDVQGRRDNQAVIQRFRAILPDKEKGIVEHAIPEATETGQRLLKLEKAEQLTVASLEELLKEHRFRDHEPKKLLLLNSSWRLPSGTQVPAKAPFGGALLALPVDEFLRRR